MTVSSFRDTTPKNELPKDSSALAEDVGPIEIPSELIAGLVDEADITKMEDIVMSQANSQHFDNLVELFRKTAEDELRLDTIAQNVIVRYENDKLTRSTLEDTLKNGFDRLTPASMSNSGSMPFEGACEIVHPLIRENAVKYQAKFCKALLPPPGPFKMDIDDIDIPNIEADAKKYEARLNNMAKRKMKFDREQERLFFYLTVAGTAFKKVSFDYNKRVPRSEFIRIEDFVVSDLAKDLDTAECYTHFVRRSKMELQRDIANGLYEDIIDDLALVRPQEDELKEATANAMDEPEISQETEVYELLEQYCYLDLSDIDPEAKDVKFPLPYQVTVDRNTNRVLSIRRNWMGNDTSFSKIVNFFVYVFVPGTGFYGLGLFHLLTDFQQTLTAITRSLVDSASFANLNAGFKKKGIRWKGDSGPLKPGEFRDIEILDNTKIQDVLMPLPFKEPSATLFNLMKDLTAQGQKFADNLDQAVNESANYGKVGTTLAILEESAGFFSSIFQRVYGYMLDELEYIAKLAADEIGRDFLVALSPDGGLVIKPASDPNYPTRSHRMQLAQAKLNLALQSPQVHNMPEAYRTFYRSLGESEETISKIVPAPEDAQPQDPVSDIMAASQGRPIKAFEGQDHDAHISIKTMFVQDPTNQNQLLGPTLQSLQANIKEHMMLKYLEQMKGLQKQIQQQQAVVAEQAQAMAAQQVLQMNQAIAQQQANGGQDNPEMVYAQAEMKKAQALEDKEKFDRVTKTLGTILNASKLDLEETKEENRAKEQAVKLGLDAKKQDLTVSKELFNMTKENLDPWMD